MYRISSFLILSLSAMSAMGVGTVTSPDGKLVVTVDTDAQGKPAYSVAYDGKDFLLPSSLGLVSNVGDFSKGLALSGMSDAVAVSDSYSLPGIKKAMSTTRLPSGGLHSRKTLHRCLSSSSVSPTMTWHSATGCCLKARLAVR